MNVKNWKKQLRKSLRLCRVKDISSVESFYNELIADKLDSGESEEQITSQLGDPRLVAERVAVEEGSFNGYVQSSANLQKTTLNVNVGALTGYAFLLLCIDGNVTCTNLDTTTNNDKIVFNGNVTVTNELKAVSDNGAIIVDGKLTANSVSLKTDNGAITAKGTIDAQRLHFETKNGKITALLEGKNADYGISVETRNGSCNVIDSEGGARKLFAKTRNGSIEITFAQQ